MIVVLSHILAGLIGWLGHWAFRALTAPPAVAVTQRQLRRRQLIDLPPNRRTPDGDDTRPLRKTVPPVWRGK